MPAGRFFECISPNLINSRIVKQIQLVLLHGSNFLFCFITDNLYLQSWSDIIIYFSYTDILATIKKMNFFWCSNLHPSEGSRQILDLQAWGLFIWEKLSRLGEEIIPTRSRHNANFHQKKISVHMSWKFPRLTGISPIANRDLG